MDWKEIAISQAKRIKRLRHSLKHHAKLRQNNQMWVGVFYQYIQTDYDQSGYGAIYEWEPTGKTIVGFTKDKIRRLCEKEIGDSYGYKFELYPSTFVSY